MGAIYGGSRGARNIHWMGSNTTPTCDSKGNPFGRRGMMWTERHFVKELVERERAYSSSHQMVPDTVDQWKRLFRELCFLRDLLWFGDPLR